VKKVKRIFFCFSLFSFLFFLLFCRGSFEKTSALEIRDAITGGLLGTWPLDEYGEFAIEFIHSVNMSPVLETFQLEDGNIRLKTVRFYSFGAGIGGDLDKGQKLSRDGDAMIISGFSDSFKELNLIIGADHVLFINNEAISLRELTGKSGAENVHITIGGN
jgi:hypothetical protein